MSERSADQTADMDKHTEEELVEGIQKAEANEPRLREEGKDEALEAQQQQRREMEEELQKRGADEPTGGDAQT